MKRLNYVRGLIKQRDNKRSAVLLWLVISIPVLLGFTALSVDLGYVRHCRNQLQIAADSAAMAAAGQLTSTSVSSDILPIAQKYALLNTVGKVNPAVASEDLVLGQGVVDDAGKVTFNAGVRPYSAVKVTIRMTEASPNKGVPLFFGGIVGKPKVEMTVTAGAMLVPRDIAVVIDLSRSMDYDSQLVHESTGINISQVWKDLGSRIYGNMKVFDSSVATMPTYSGTNTNIIKNNLKVNSVAYPYTGGSWDEYVTYVKGTSPSGVPAIPTAYVNRYGLRTFINYLLAAKTLSTQTPALANTQAQPMYALKQAVQELCSYLTVLNSGDNVSLHSYSDVGHDHQTLTSDYSLISLAVFARQAGQDGPNTNISAGIEKGITELMSTRARRNAKKVIFIITDGNANLPSNSTTGAQAAIDSATHAISHGIQVYTITLGSLADQNLMTQVAAIGKGIEYYVPTLDITQYSDELKNIFRTLGGKRPVELFY
jgi:Flp pilus assembly protein TadG